MGNKTVKANWEAIDYTITYENLKGASNPNPATYTIESPAITFANLANVTGYAFTGWSPANIPSGSTGNKTITAQWTAVVVDGYYYVDITKPNDNGNGKSWANAKKTIQAAVELAVKGDTIIA
jgi:hypothetical protein